MCVCLVGQSCQTLCDPMDCSLPGFSDHGNCPGKNTGVGCHVSFRGSSQPKDWTQVSRIAAQFFTIWITRETQSSILSHPSSVKWKLLSPVWLFGTPWTIQSRPDTGMGSLSILQGSSQPGDQRRSPTFSSVQFSLSVMSSSLRPHEPQHARPPCPSPTPGVYPNPCPLSLWPIQLSHPLSSPSPPTFNLSQNQCLFKWVSSSHQVAKVLELQIQYQSFQWTPRTDFLKNGLVRSPCSPRDLQESSPTPQFKSINSALSFFYSPTLTSIHDYWKNHNLD